VLALLDLALLCGAIGREHALETDRQVSLLPLHE